VFIGHFAVAYASKRVAPRTSLGWTFAACQFADLLWPILVLAGVEHFRVVRGDTAFTPLSFDYYPWSHSLLMNAVWGVALGALYLALHRDRRGAVVIAGLVVSHWVLDWITHRPDMPLAPGNATKLGLGLWNSIAATIVVEVAMYVAGFWIYMRSTRPIDKLGLIGPWPLAGFLFASYLGNVVTPPPEDPRTIAWGALAMWVLVPVAAWLDRHRTA
jgi:membrane-bound metal-dependent hydrolase YbcI (DUF457 family)